MHVLRRIFTLIALAGCLPAFAADSYTFDYNSRCQLAYQHYMALRLPEGDALIRQEFLANPRNLMATYLADYSDLLLLLFNGNREELAQRDDHLEERLRLLDRAADNQPWKRLCKAGLYMHWAMIRGRFGENFSAATTFRKSYLLLKENRDRFPAFAPNNIFLGTEEALAGTIPDSYRWLAAILGMKGNVRKGAARLSAYLEAHPSPAEPLRQEAVIYLQYIRFYLLSQQEAAWSYVSSPQFPVADNLLHAFVRANLALNYRKAETALQTLKGAQALPNYRKFPVFDFELANALLFRLDFGCIPYYEQYVRQNAGQLYTKDALEKIAYAWYLQGDRARAEGARKRIPASGNLLTDADKQAQRFASAGAWPNTLLLEARLLTDGGYAAQALGRLSIAAPAIIHTPADRLEYAFRLGKACEETGDAAKAVQAYLRAVELGKDRREQYGARAALQLGLLYERRGQTAEALQYFRLCLTMKDHDFQSSIDQQAKAGVNRLTGAS